MSDLNQNILLKSCYGLENLYFYIGKNKRFHCKYISNPETTQPENYEDLLFLMAALSYEQGEIFFDDVGETCKGISQLKEKYLVFRLAGIL